MIGISRRGGKRLRGILLGSAVVLASLGPPRAPAPARAAEPAQPQAAAESPCARLPPDDLKRICERGRLIVARYAGERPPFFSAAGGDWEGFDVDLARDIASRLEVGYELAPAESFDRVVERVAAGEADVGISKLSITLDRSRRVRFTRPYMTVYQTLLVNRLSAPRQEDPFVFLNRPAARIGALAGSAYVGYAQREFPSAEIVPHSDFAGMMADVTDNRLHAALVDSARANTWRRHNPERLIRVRAFIARDRKDQLAFAVNWRDTHLLAWLDLYLASIRQDGSAERLYRKWFGAGEPAGDGAGGADG